MNSADTHDTTTVDQAAAAGDPGKTADHVQRVSLSVELVNATLNYLAARPWHEVHALIAGVQDELRAAG